LWAKKKKKGQLSAKEDLAEAIIGENVVKK